MKISIMKTNKWILGGLMAMAITACTSDELVENNSQQPAKGEVVSVTAYTPGDGNSSRVALNDKPDDKPDDGLDDGLVSLTWEANDSFTVIQGNAKTNFTNGDGGGNTFTGVLPDGVGNFYAFYPATSLTKANTVPFILSEQTGALNARKTYMRSSSTDGLSYSFQHCTAILKATFSNDNFTDNTKIKEVKVKTLHPDSKVDGNLNLATGEISDGSNNTITINYTTPVDASKPVYIYLPPMDKDKKALNFSVTVKDSNGDEKVYTAILEGNPESPIEAGSLYNVGVIQLEEDNNPYFSFTNNMGSPKTFTLKKQGTLNANLQYSLNGGGWLTWSTGVDVPNQGVLRLRGANKNGENYIGTAVDSRNYLYISITNPNNPSAASNENNGNVLPTGIICSGDIRTLINYKDYENVNTASARFCYLFSECGTSLTDISGLQLLPVNATMASSCYYGMFKGCSGLTSIPEGLLPATTLAESCYEYMFSSCRGLTGIPANLLPAGKNGGELAKGCYSYMFSGCSKLTSIPEVLLPATTLAESCYKYMFSSCSGLTGIPAGLLPAGKNSGELAKGCYSYMFSGCSKLTAIPEALLPATTLAESCYSSMFQGCSGFSTIPERLLPATILAKSCYAGMFGYCSDQRTDRAPEYGLSNIPAGLLPAGKNGVGQLAESCYDSMFESCRFLKNIPEDLLPATTLAKSCYYAMFAYSYLETIPAGLLPATTLAESCYEYMFLECKRLNSVPEGLLPATTMVPGCYRNMFYECSNLQTVPANFLPATTLAHACYAYMFLKCSKLKVAPTLPATTLVSACYFSMFSYCTKLNKVTILATVFNTENNYSVKNYFFYDSYNVRENWLGQVSPSGTIYIAKGQKSTLSEVIPSGWTVREVDNQGALPSIGNGGGFEDITEN